MRRDNVIAIDFDGTIYDAKKKVLLPGSACAIRQLNEWGFVLVLWTCRTGKRLRNALNILEKYNLLELFQYVNKTPDFIPYKISCKVCAKWYIDDRNIGGFIGWEKVLEYVSVEINDRRKNLPHMEQNAPIQKKN